MRLCVQEGCVSLFTLRSWASRSGGSRATQWTRAARFHREGQPSFMERDSQVQGEGQVSFMKGQLSFKERGSQVAA